MCPFLELFVSTLVLFTIIGRWMYPTKNAIGKEDITEMLLMFLNHGADIVDFFSYVDEPEITKHYTTVMVILFFFSTSVTQFSINTIGRRKTNVRNAGVNKVLDVLFGTCAWNLVFMLLIQDIPFFIMRLIILTTFEKTSKNYSLYLFSLKNVLKISVLTYRIITAIRYELKIKMKFTETYAMTNLD